MTDRRPPLRLVDEDGLEPVIISARTASEAHRELRRAVDALTARDGGTSPALRSVLDAITRAAHAYRFRPEVTAEVTEQARDDSGSSDEVDVRMLLTVKQAAGIIGCSEEWVRQLVASKVLTSRRNDAGHHRLYPDEIDGYLSHRSRSETPE